MKITTGLGAAPQAVALACLLPLLISSCAIPHSGKTAPRVQRGCIDLSGWDFENDGPVELDGEWEFYWKKFTRTGAASRREYGGKTEYLAVPGIWNGKVLHGRKLAGDGYATYRLRMLFNSRNPRGRKKLAVKVNDIATAYCLFVNGVRIAAGGSVGVSPALAEPGYRPDIAGFETEGGEADLVLHVSNFHHRKGGAWRSFTLGTERDIRERIEKNIMRDLFLFGSIFIMACYHLLLFSHRNREKSHCYFGLFCFLIALRILVTGEYYLAILAPAVAWEHVLRLEYLTVYLSVPVFFMFVQSLYRGEFKRRILYIAQGAGLIFAVTVIVTPSRVFTWTMQIYQFLTTLLCLYGLYALLRARARTREGSLTFLVGFIILFASVINDFMRSNHLVDTLYSVPLGLFIFIFSQSFLLARRFSRAFATLETLSEELEFKNTRLVEMDRLKNEFLAEVSHELRTPLNGMVGISESMLSQRFESMSISFRRNLALIAASGKRLAGLVDEILDLARLKNRDTVLNMRPVDIKTLADVVIILSRTVVGEKKVELVNSIAPWMPFACADENRVQQILINLVEYAVAFAEEGEVAISAELAVRGRDRSWMEIFVTAASGGVPADRNDAAQRSGYADEFNARINGDIGLSIARQLVELHGGSMRVESACAPGPVFSFTLPLFEEEDSALSDQETHAGTTTVQVNGMRPPALVADLAVEQGRGKSGELLIVDDDRINLQVMSACLSSEDYSVAVAGSAAEALELLNRKPFDLVVLDVMMPKMSGYEICRELRKRYSLHELPVLILTARNSITDLVAAFEAGANDYLTKPIHRDEILMRVRTLTTLKKIAHDHDEARFKLLQERMNPHFLFNALNTVHALIGRDREKADRAVIMLADNYRFLIEHSFRSLIPFEEEWRFVANYLELEGIRFSDTLHVSMEREGDFSGVLMPPLTVQPVVENSLRHGVRHLAGEGRIRVTARMDSGRVEVVVEDNGPGIDSDDIYSRTLGNIRKRLNYFCDDVGFIVQNRKEGGTRVIISFGTDGAARDICGTGSVNGPAISLGGKGDGTE